MMDQLAWMEECEGEGDEEQEGEIAGVGSSEGQVVLWSQ